MVATHAGCATTEVHGRQTERKAPLRGVPTVPAAVQSSARLDAGSDVLTDDELRSLEAALDDDLGAAFAALPPIEGRTARTIGEGRVVDCRVRAGPGRAYTLYEARCRVQIVVDGAALIDVNATAVRRVRSRAIGEDEAKEIARHERNALLTVDDTHAALQSALVACAQLVRDGKLPAQQGDPPPIDDAALRGLALRRLERDENKAAALVDLARFGVQADAARVVPLLDSDDARTRLAAAQALSALCTPDTEAALTAHQQRGDDDALVARAVDDALRSVRACAQLR